MLLIVHVAFSVNRNFVIVKVSIVVESRITCNVPFCPASGVCRERRDEADTSPFLPPDDESDHER